MTDTAKTSKSPVLMPEPQHTMLGQATTYHDTYDASLLTPIPRKLGRDAIGRHDFQGHDYWHLFEVTWLSPNGLPQVAAGLMTVPATTECIVESKSLKLYVGSFTQSVFPSKEAVEAAVQTVFMDHDLDLNAVKGVYSIDLKRQEAGLLAACAAQDWSAAFYTAEELRAVAGKFTDSPFVQEMTGVGNVCERAAMRGAEKLLVKKTAVDGVTVAVAAEHWEVSFG